MNEVRKPYQTNQDAKKSQGWSFELDSFELFLTVRYFD
jgi:hypothetical protein